MDKQTHALTGFILLIIFTAAYTAGAIDIPPLEEKVQEIQLDNGLKVVVVERHIAPVFFALMNFRVGSSIEETGKSGLSHFMEHMLFKGSETIGTKDYEKERPIMDELEQVASEMRDLQISLEKWRYEIFEEYAAQVKSDLPPEVREQAEADESGIRKAVLEALPVQRTELPSDYQKTVWLLSYNGHDYWVDYRTILMHRMRMAQLIKEQREYIVQSELDCIYDELGAKNFNAFTANDQTGYTVGLPSNCLELWMYLEADRFQNPVFREFYSEREVVQEEFLGHENNPWRFLYHNLIQNAFVAHPYGRPVIGWREDIQLTLRSEMDEHFHRFYAPNNCQITIVGNVNADEVFRFARQYFSSWKLGEVAHEVTIKEPEQKSERRVAVEFDAEPQLMMGYHIPAAPHPDCYALQMMNAILSFGRTSRFYRSIFEEQKLTGSPPNAFIGPADRYPSLFIIGAAPNVEHSQVEVETAIWNELEKLKQEQVSERELERIHNLYKVYQLVRLKSNRWLAFSLAIGFVNHGDWRKTIIEDFERLMTVTADDIQRVANKYFTPRNRTVAFLVKPDTEETVPIEQNQGGKRQ